MKNGFCREAWAPSQLPASVEEKPGPGSFSPTDVSTAGRTCANPWGKTARKPEREAQLPTHPSQEKLPLTLDILIVFIVPTFEQKDTVKESWFRTLFIKSRGGAGRSGKKSKGSRGGGQPW